MISSIVAPLPLFHLISRHMIIKHFFELRKDYEGELDNLCDCHHLPIEILK